MALNATAADVGDRTVESEVELRDVLAILRRRLWVVAAALILIVGVAYVLNEMRPAVYTASTLLQRQSPQSPFQSVSPLPLAGLNPGEMVGSQIEVIRSTSVLLRVVDSLSLRVHLDDRDLVRGSVIRGASVAGDALPGHYELKRKADKVELLANGRVLDTTRPGGELRAAGVRLLLADPLPDRSIGLSVSYPEQAVNRLRRELGVAQVGRTALIRLSYTSTDPELAADVVGAIATVYQRQVAMRDREDSRRRREFIAGQLVAVADSLRQAQAHQRSYQERSGTIDPSVEGEALITRSMAAEQELREMRYREGILETVNRALAEPGAGDDALRRIVALGADVVPGAEALYSRLQDLRAQRGRLTASRYGYTAEGAQVEVIDSLIAETKHEMRKMTSEALQVVRSRKADAEQRVASLEGSIRNLPARSTEYLSLRQQAEAIQSAYDMLSEKYFEAQVAEAAEGGDVQIVDPVRVPVLPDPKHLSRDLAMALILGLIIGVIAAVSVEYFDRRIRRAEDAERMTGAPVLVSVPTIATELAPGQVVDGPRSPASEAFRSLQTMIRFSVATEKPVLVVTSPAAGEGKSTVSSNLALALRAGGGRVLLIDADFPRPAQHLGYRIERSPGLSDALINDISINDVIRRDIRPNLDLMPAGTAVPGSADLLSRRAFAEAIRSLRAQYDSIVIDTAPLLLISDTSVLADLVDGFVLVARAGKTSRAQLRSAAERARRIGARLIGLVLNDTGQADADASNSAYYGVDDGTAQRGLVSRLRGMIGG